MRKFILAALLTVWAAMAAPKDILILHSYRAGYDWTDELTRGFRTKFAEAGEYSLWFEHLDARRTGYPQNVSFLRDHFAQKHKGRSFALVIAADDEALDFVAHRSEGVFGDTPVVFCGISEAELVDQLPRDRFTGLIEVFDAERILTLALRLLPNTKHVYYVSDNTPFGQALARVFQQASSRAGPGIAYRYLDGHREGLEEIKRQVGSIPPDSVVLMSQFRQDNGMRYVDATAGELAIAAAAAAPVFGVAISQVGQGVLMGTPNRGYEHSSIATQAALRILSGTSPAAVPIERDGGLSFLFDANELKRWNIPENRLPRGSRILNAPPGIWRDYWQWIVGGAVFAAFQLLVIALLVRNIARRKRVQRELRAALEAARGADAMKTRFIANMSHELRTPMNGVLGMLQALQATDLDQDQRESASVAADSAQSLLTVLNDLLDISQIDAGRLKIVPGRFSLQREIPRICRLMNTKALAAGVPLHWKVAPSIPACLVGDGHRLRQVLINLTSNALKFTSKGEVRIEARELARTGEQTTIRLEVHDTGIGIAPELMGRIFDPFFQADDSSARRFGGTGLGLAISRELVQLMGGRIGGESTPGSGSMFWLEIPFAYEVEAAKPEPVPAGAPNFEGRVVLLVEDNSVNRAVARKMLERTGCRTVLAENGAECLERLREQHVDLILMDVQMPGMSGLEATRRIREGGGSNGRVPIIALTASSMVGDREACLAAGMDDYLSKPIAADQLMEVLLLWMPGAQRAAAQAEG